MEVNNSLPTGTVLKGLSYSYRIERTLGQGSFGITYLASVKMAGALGTIDANIKVAIKEFFMRDINGRSDSTVTSGSKGGIYDDYKRKFTREAVNLSKLQHPNIIKVIESFEANNTVYYVMEYIGGGSLDAYITKNNGLKEDEAIKIVKQIGSALSFMHKNKMLHLDVKPSNIMLKEYGDVVLIDFGLSKQYGQNGEPESSTRVGAGTPGYAPLEQANYREGKGFPVTMDVYALGATMFKMLTGVRPPEASDILNDGFPDKDLKMANVSHQLIGCIEKAMNPTKKSRYQTVVSFIDAIESVKNEIETSKETILKVSVVDDSDLETEIDSACNSDQYKTIKFIFKEKDKVIPFSLINPTLISNGLRIALKDESYTFSGKEFNDVWKILSRSLDYRIKQGCETIDLRHVNNICTIQVEHVSRLIISFSPYKKPKIVILSSSHGVFPNSDVRDILEITLPGYIEDYSYAIESDYYEYQSGELSSLLKNVKLYTRSKIELNNDDVLKNSSKSNKSLWFINTPWIILATVSFVAILSLLVFGKNGCSRQFVQAEYVDTLEIDTIQPDTIAKDFSVKGVSFKMMFIEGGTFQTNPTVIQSDYYIGETEVTQELWIAVMGSNPSDFKGAQLPVENVSWNDCQEFITKLNSLTGETFRLPTEAEWEYAARGGSKCNGYEYSGSNIIDDVAWYEGNSGKKTHEVATKQANELGIYDMSGNVYEWCQDSSSTAQTTSSSSFRVFCGGSWLNDASYCRSAIRFMDTPVGRNNHLGFRLALQFYQDTEDENISNKKNASIEPNLPQGLPQNGRVTDKENLRINHSQDKESDRSEPSPFAL